MNSHPLPKLTLVLGGARSGKSRHAESLVTAGEPPWRYVATAEPHDAEMAERIATHRRRRAAGWVTIDAPLEPAAVLGEPWQGATLLDCLTLWLSNVMLAGRDVDAEVGRLLDALARSGGPVVAVSNEVGLGIVPDNALARHFRDAQGILNQKVAAAADRVVLMAAGLPITIKG